MEIKYIITKQERDVILEMLAEVPAKYSFKPLVILNQIKECPEEQSLDNSSGSENHNND